MKRTLVIGNGFDLDTGLKTSYSDFVRSSYWPFNNSMGGNGHNTLGSYLQKKRLLSTWFDVEEALYSYAKCGLGRATICGFDIGEHDKDDFNKLKSSLTHYLHNQEKIFEKSEGSTAIGVLYALLTCGGNLKIYSFNYTDLRKIAGRFAVSDDFTFEHMHGSISGNDIILGIGDMSDINPHYYYFKKVAASNFASHPIVLDMVDSDEVVIFGHSLSANDYPYFKPYFHYLLEYSNLRKNQRKLTIFTRSEKDMIEIKRQIEALTDNGITLLYSLNQVNIFCTDGSMSDILNPLISIGVCRK